MIGFLLFFDPTHKQPSLRRSLYPAPPTRPPPFSDQHSLEYTMKKQMELWGTANGEDQLCIILGRCVVLL